MAYQQSVAYEKSMAAYSANQQWYIIARNNAPHCHRARRVSRHQYRAKHHARNVTRTLFALEKHFGIAPTITAWQYRSYNKQRISQQRAPAIYRAINNSAPTIMCGSSVAASTAAA